ncbi:DUF1801 domain-containing protein [Paenibacillus aurantius]|uniref:DUF1801 domain-containing protein n=1 Tax=Paenibacillus aurantius TaxID=2918900 RepID=A0AA96LBY8_9BACL|nr:DUF1801 domain-containing protein [Paenibacillus aurantius]WNQ10897.1 DUF1801 domain-containing protein [Paenibacillus aurantius]
MSQNSEAKPAKSGRRTGAEEVAEFLDRLEHPRKAEIEEVRRLVLAAYPPLTEHIKWNAPSFCWNGEDRITFNLQGKGFFRLIFHCGAKKRTAAGEGSLIEDPYGLLEWASPDRAILPFTDREDVRAKRDKLADLVTRWVEAAGSFPPE